jgi:hypothetical protein
VHAFKAAALFFFMQSLGVLAADRIDYLDNGTLKIGINLDLGGSITYLSKSGTTENLINSWDWGRQIQQSYYSGPIPFGNPAPEWKTLGWNPIQSGDHFRNRSKIVEHKNDGKELYVKTIPMIWPVDNVVGECTFETWITLEGNAAKVRCRLNNARADKTQYPARHQELPAVYTNGVYWKLMTYTGDKPFTGGDIARIAKKEGGGFPWKSWHATECWAALVNDADWGLGIHTPGTYNYMGGFAGKENTGGEKDDPCGYIAPVSRELIDHNIVYDYSYTLILGSLKEIRDHVYKNKNAPQTSWIFKSDRQRWSFTHATDTGWPIKDHLHLNLEWADPQLFSPEIGWNAKDVTKLKIRAATNAKNPKAQLFWKTLHDQNFSGERCVHFEWKPDGKFHDYEIDFSANGNYSGLITQFRLDPVPSGGEGEYIKIERIGE